MAALLHKPSHAYVPGVNGRHEEGAFDFIRVTAKEGMAVDELEQSLAFTCGIDYIGNGFYWEAHEVLEAVWMVIPNATPEKHLVQGLIQYANACLKMKMSRPKAARRLCAIARDLLLASKGHNFENIDPSTIFIQIENLEKDIMQNNA